MSRCVVAVALLFAAGSVGAAAHAQDTAAAEVARTLPFKATEGDGAAPRPDDVMELGVLLFRGSSPTPTFHFEGPRVYEIGADGARSLVALRVRDGKVSAALMPPDEALALPPDLLAGLRGISFDGWSERFAPMLRRINPRRCVVDIAVGLHRRLPPLPDGLRALRVEAFLDAPIDLSGLASQGGLRLLIVGRANVTDWSPLSGMPGLLHLEAPVTARAASTVPTLPALRTFSAGHDDDVTDVAFLARFPALVEADLRGTGVTDLSPIERLQHIRRVLATNTDVTTLPSGTLPSLRTLSILGHGVPPEALRAFLRANPRCATEHSWMALLDAGVAGIDGLRLRTGGMCHRSPLEEDTLFETRAPDELRAFLATIAIDEPASRGMCTCCGGPTIELLRGDEVATSLSLHHGQTLRWRGWPADGRLTPDAADALCAWISAHGKAIVSPRQASARAAVEATERDAAQDRLLGAERGAAARACADDAAFATLVCAAEPDTGRRIVLLLRLADLAGGTADTAGARVAGRARAALRGEDPRRLGAVLLATLTSAESPDDLLRAAAKAVIGLDDDDSPLPAETLTALRLPAARLFVAADDADVRSRALWLLERQDSPEADALAMSMLPVPGEDGVPGTQPTRDELELALEIARFCAQADLPRLRALVAASRAPESWSWQLERTIERRER